MSLGEIGGVAAQVVLNVQNLLDKDEAGLGLIAFATGGDPCDKIGRTYKLGLRFRY